MSHNPQCQCKAIAVNIIALDKLLTENNQKEKPKNEAIEAYINTFIKKVKEVCPQAKNKNITLAAAYTTAGHDNMAKIIKTIVQDTEQDCSWIKEQSDKIEETKESSAKASSEKDLEEKTINPKDFKQVNELFAKIFEKIASEKGIKVSVVHVPKNKEE